MPTADVNRGVGLVGKRQNRIIYMCCTLEHRSWRVTLVLHNFSGVVQKGDCRWASWSVRGTYWSWDESNRVNLEDKTSIP